MQKNFDFIVVGNGASGLLAANRLVKFGRVALVSKGDIRESNTYQAQGGIAGVMHALDSVQSHVQDTLRAGAGLCHEEVVQRVIERGSSTIQNLISLGTGFDHHEGELHLTQEGGHSNRRIAHAQDATGQAISNTLATHLHANDNIHFFKQHMAIDLITTHQMGCFREQKNRCLGLYVLSPIGEILSLGALHVILATGGVGKVYMYTTNPSVATGDGMAMAWRAGCPMMNLEFMQFHPTTLYHAQSPSLLLSEALRGEGAHLLNKSGHRFVFDYHEKGEMASRDIVARAIDHEIKKTAQDCMFLDARHLGKPCLQRHFPNISKRLLGLGLDMSTQQIPIVPAAHYMCGGVQTTLSGQTAVDSLYVVGESACSGLHGANRLASNSLLECLVMAELCVESILKTDVPAPTQRLPTWDSGGIFKQKERIQIKQNWHELRATMSNYVGIVRSDERLHRALRRQQMIQEEMTAYYWQHPVDRDLLELRNISLLSELIIRSALQRKESRGLHYSLDYPEFNAKKEDTVLSPH
ncbi:MAG: L-aspartate oxidase [Mariprofundaceae bacterium]|nr:L-aspartate oxidase [Mariprofundaceae bacterium]